MTEAEATVTRQCTAVSKRTGRRCKHSAIRGGTVCYMHGGGAPQVKAAAASRIAEAQAQAAAAETYIRLTGRQPDNPLEALKQLAARFHAIENDLFARIAREPEQMATLLPAWGASASRYLDVLTGWIRAEPPQAPPTHGVLESQAMRTDLQRRLERLAGGHPVPAPLEGTAMALPPATEPAEPLQVIEPTPEPPKVVKPRPLPASKPAADTPVIWRCSCGHVQEWKPGYACGSTTTGAQGCGRSMPMRREDALRGPRPVNWDPAFPPPS